MPSNQRQLKGQAKFSCSSLGKDFEEQTEKKICALKVLGISNKTKISKNQSRVYSHKIWWMIWFVLS